MDIQGLRQSLKMKWLSYYAQNRAWLVKMRVWATYNGLRRPSSGFILATLSVLEPEFDQVLAFIMELNNDPDEIVTALGLNFNPDAELRQTQLNQQQNKVSASNGCVVNNASHNQQSESQPLLSLVQKPAPININQVDEHKAIGNTSPKVKAVSNNGNNVYAHSVEMAVSDRTRSSTAIPVKPKPPSIRLALASETIPNSKTIRVLEITTKVPVQQKTLPLLTLATETTQTEQYVNVNSFPTTNATTLASWVDEFCQGTGFEREEVCSKDFSPLTQP
ncbi:MAG TPA: DUF5331 domain-containing protein [Leptolyngbyaceae cyanobacterium]